MANIQNKRPGLSEWLVKHQKLLNRTKHKSQWVHHPYRNEELQLLISSGQMIQADEQLQTIILDQRGSAAPQLWRNSDCRSRPPFSTSPRHCCLPEEPTQHAALASFVSERPKEAPWTRLILNMQDIFSNRLIIFCDEDIPLQRFSDICYTEDCRTSIVDNDNNVISDFKNSTGHSPNNKNSNRNELAIIDNFNNIKSPLKSCEIYDAPGVLSGRDDNVKRRKSVSFDDDVLVYLFDQVLSVTLWLSGFGALFLTGNMKIQYLLTTLLLISKQRLCHFLCFLFNFHCFYS